jgi:hypothetical protein
MGTDYAEEAYTMSEKRFIVPINKGQWALSKNHAWYYIPRK